MTAYGVVISVLLVFPWVLFGVVFVGVALERLGRSLRSGRLTLQPDRCGTERSTSSAVSMGLLG